MLWCTISAKKHVMIALQRAWFRFDLGMDHFIMIFFWRGGGGYSHTLPIRVCASKGVVILKLLMSCRTGYPFQRRFLERGIIFRTQERSSSFVSSHLKLFKDRLFLKIRFNALTRKLLHSCCTLERSIKNWSISRTGYQF